MTSFLDAGVAPGTEYVYRVIVTYPDGSEGVSDPVQFLPTAAAPTPTIAAAPAPVAALPAGPAVNPSSMSAQQTGTGLTYSLILTYHHKLDTLTT